ncbi:MAG TPA: MFS transporter [Clostridia bacterium]|nr:MFS transporter [Clostridia bacterium]
MKKNPELVQNSENISSEETINTQNISETADKKPLKLNYPQTIKVGFAFAIIMLFWTAYDFVVPLLLENAYGLSNMMRGLIMGLDNLLSLVLLPLFGKLSDKSKGKLFKKWGRRTPFIVFGTIAAVVLMVFVPISAQKQLERSTVVRAEYETQLNDEEFMNSTLSMFYQKAEEGTPKYCDLTFLKMNGLSKTEYIAIRFDNKLETKSGFLGTGSKTYLYDGEEVALTDIIGGKTVEQIKNSNAQYDKYVKSGMTTLVSEKVNERAISSPEGINSLITYMVVLLFTLIAMATFRSPAVALMPDVTPKPLRSQGNAMINLIGGVGGAIAFLIYTVVLFGDSLKNYIFIFGAVGAGMLLLLIFFLLLVKERKLVDKCNNICEDYGITDADEEKLELAKIGGAKEAEGSLAVVAETPADGAIDVGAEQFASKGGKPSFNDRIEAKFNAKYANLSQEERRVKLAKAKNLSFILILASIFMWFMGYNAVSSNLSIYCVKALNLKPSVASIISGVSMGVSAIAFIPVGMLAVKIGRRKSIMLGFGLATISFILLATSLIANAEVEIAKAALFSLFYLIAGFGLIIANVNTFPMVVELAKAEDVGKYTGFYYTATMSAQAITPFLAGAIMDKWGNASLFAYSAACIVIAIVIMIFVRYGDSMQIPKGKKLNKEEKKQVMLDAMDSAD